MAEIKLYTVSMRVNETQKNLLERRSEEACLTVGQYLQERVFPGDSDHGVSQEEPNVLKNASLSNDVLEGLKFFGKHYKMLVRNLLALKIDSHVFADKYLTQDEVSYLDDRYDESFETYGIKKSCDSEADSQ